MTDYKEIKEQENAEREDKRTISFSIESFWIDIADQLSGDFDIKRSEFLRDAVIEHVHSMQAKRAEVLDRELADIKKQRELVRQKTASNNLDAPLVVTKESGEKIKIE